MPALNPDGLPVQVGTVSITSPGLVGIVEVLQPQAPGTRGAELTTEDFLASLARNGVEEDLTVEISDHRELTATTGSRAAGGPDDIVVELTDPGRSFGQVVLYTAEDGSMSWHLADQTAPAGTTRGGGTLTYRIPRDIVPSPAPADTASRGLLGAVGKKLIKVLVFRLLDDALQAGANRFARRFEEQHRPHLLRPFTPGDYTAATAGALDDAALRSMADGPALLFVHGTASSSSNGFGHLPPDVFRTLYDRYGGRVLAFDHPTISVTPTENVQWLADRLQVLGDRRLNLDVVSHSRGGLVARNLTEHPELLGGRANVDRLIMVATPNAGTALADPDHLLQLLNRLTSLLQLVPSNGVTDVLDIVLAVLKQVAVGVFKGLDGLMAMNPTGDYLTTYLNTPSSASARYFAVASNFEPPHGSSLLRIARDGVTDLVFGRAGNDLVVPTDGVFTVPGASSFPIAAPVLFAAAAGVDHSSYWPQQNFTSALLEWLAPEGSRADVRGERCEMSRSRRAGAVLRLRSGQPIDGGQPWWPTPSTCTTSPRATGT